MVLFSSTLKTLKTVTLGAGNGGSNKTYANTNNVRKELVRMDELFEAQDSLSCPPKFSICLNDHDRFYLVFYLQQEDSHAMHFIINQGHTVVIG